jgi:Rrf2 family iron-sulfur cluster assembly transcriptional regulator
MLSKTGTHATLAMALLAGAEPGVFLGAAQIARAVGAPGNYLGKLLKRLAAEGLVESQKGYGGGFRLTRPASKIKVYDIVEPLDRVSRWSGCFLGRPTCNPNRPCAVHRRWAKVRDQYLHFLKETTLAELAARM